MFKRLDKNNSRILAFRIFGEITDKETDQLGNLLIEKHARYGKLRILVAIDQYPSLNSTEALYEDLRFAKIHSALIDRIAVIGDKASNETWVAIFGLFGGIRMAYFDFSEMEGAQTWLLAPSV